MRRTPAPEGGVKWPPRSSGRSSGWPTLL